MTGTNMERAHRHIAQRKAQITEQRVKCYLIMGKNRERDWKEGHTPKW